MVFNDTTDKNGLIQMCEALAGLDDGAISGNTLKMARFTQWINQSIGLVLCWIFVADGQWHFDDGNYATFPISTTDLVNNQRDYSLPADLLNIRQVEVLGLNGKYDSLSLLSEDDYRRRMENMQEEAGTPNGYYLQGNSIFVYPKPTSAYATLTAGLRITYDRYADYFTTLDTTQTPGIVQIHHPVLVKLACLEYFNGNDMDRYNRTFNEIYAQKIGLKEQIENHYSKRNKDDRTTIGRTKLSYK